MLCQHGHQNTCTLLDDVAFKTYVSHWSQVWRGL